MVRREGLSVREAARRLGLSRNTASKWLKEDVMVEPRYPRRAAAASILEPYKARLEGWLKADAHRGKRDRRGVKEMFEALRALG
jgi:transcriptional regulator with XRE-family HTH domain